jgi:calcium-dependent protein kinase
LKKSHLEEDDRAMIMNEISNLQHLDHPNILKMYEYFED